MSTLTCPTLFKRFATTGLAAFLLAACASEPATSPTAPAMPASQAVTAVPSVVISGKTGKSILDSVIRHRTQKGMRLIQRESNRVMLGIAIPKSSPPAEARMIFSLSPAPEGLRLSAQVFQVTKQGSKSQNTEITENLRENLEEELRIYAR